MRRLFRPELDPALDEYLNRMQAAVDAGARIVQIWKAQRQTPTMRRVAQVLAEVAGLRERCMYCEDSRGTDIEHFRPKTLYPAYVFRWHNFLWICAGCNRSKSSRFPCDDIGQPLLLDPTVDEPWDYLFFDPDTGEIAARWDSTTGVESPKGLAMLEVISSLRHQAVTEGRRRVYQRLKKAVLSFLTQSADGTPPSEERISDLLEEVDYAVDYGLAAWFFLREGQSEESFRMLRLLHPSVWARAVGRIVAVST